MIDLYPSKYETNSAGDKVYKTMVDNRGQILTELYDEDDPNTIPTHTLALADGQENVSASIFGSVRGAIFSDDNGNGMKDSGEDGIRTQVTITTDPVLIVDSGRDGNYTIPHVREGAYEIMVQIPNNYYDTTSESTKNVSVMGDSDTIENFGLKPLVTVTGTVFDDVNDSGVMDAGESGISDATVSINTTPVKTVTTGNDGIYSIDMVPAGSYTLTVTQSGYADITRTVTAMGGETNTENFALGSVGTVMGTIYNDMNNNGMMDEGESGIPNIMVSITGTSLDTTTNDDGMYTIGMVPAGQQTVTIPAQDNFIGDVSKTVTVGDNPVDFALVPVGTVMGTVSNSLSEEGISGIMVSITGTELTAMTGTNGMYEIMNVPVGTYDVTLDVSDGYLGSTSMQVSVSQGMSATVGFTLTPVGMVSGMVFSDTNGNGDKDALETGLASITVSITDTDFTAVTDNDGMYTINNVPVGDYVVTVTSTDTHFAEMTTVSISVTHGGTETVNFALVPRTEDNTATISGVIFNDVNGNGMQDGDEGGYGEYSEMILTNTTSSEVVKQDTDANGMYSFDVLADNTYTIQTSFFPAGVTVLDPASSWYRENVTPTAGQNVTFDVGFHTVIEGEYSMLDLTVFIDTNSNGVMDEGETGLPLVFIVYTYTIGPENVTTDAQGKLLHKLVPADWAITGLPAGYAPTVYSYERSDDTEGKNYDSAILVADDPEKNSTHTMIIGLVPTS